MKVSVQGEVLCDFPHTIRDKNHNWLLWCAGCGEVWGRVYYGQGRRWEGLPSTCLPCGEGSFFSHPFGWMGGNVREQEEVLLGSPLLLAYELGVMEAKCRTGNP